MNYQEICNKHELEQLSGAYVSEADLRGADLRSTGVVILIGELYPITICKGIVSVGCQMYTVRQWRKFSKDQIVQMDGKNSLKYYKRLLDLIDFYCGKGERPNWVNAGTN